MKQRLQAFAVAAIAFFNMVASAEEFYENGVLVLDSDNFDEAILNYEYLLV